MAWPTVTEVFNLIMRVWSFAGFDENLFQPTIDATPGFCLVRFIGHLSDFFHCIRIARNETIADLAAAETGIKTTWHQRVVVRRDIPVSWDNRRMTQVCQDE